jgi:hypothetical protein
MAEWIEIPAHRVLRIERNELWRDFRVLDAQGNEMDPHCDTAMSPFRIQRKRDGKMFMTPRYHQSMDDFAGICYLEELA